MIKLGKVALLITLCLFFSCQQIETHDSLSNKQIEHIKSLGLLDENELILKFYSEHTQEIAGNFFTNKRVANYWIDGNDSSKNQKNMAFYNEIINIDTIYSPGFTYCPYMLIKKKNGNSFKVCVDGKRNEIKSFFEDVLTLWKKVNR